MNSGEGRKTNIRIMHPVLIVLIFCALAAAASASAAASNMYEQVHLALAGSCGVRVMFFTQEAITTPIVRFRKQADLLDDAAATVAGSSRQYLENYGWHHVVLLSDLQPSTRYYYAVGDSSSSTLSEIFNFRTPDNDKTSTQPINVAVFGDMGWLDSIQRPMGKLGDVTQQSNWSAVFTRQLLEKLKDEEAIDMVFHVGDLGYADSAAFHSMKAFVHLEYEEAYNGWMNWMQVSSYQGLFISLATKQPPLVGQG